MEARLQLFDFEFGLRLPGLECIIIGSLSTEVFEPRTANGNLIFPFLERFHAIAFVTSSHSHQQELFLNVVRNKTTPKKETFDFRLPSVAYELSVLKLPNCKSQTRGASLKSAR